MKSFLQRHAAHIQGVLSGFDRVRFRGTFRMLAHGSGMSIFLTKMRVLLKDFARFSQETTERLREGVEAVAQRDGRPIEYLTSAAVDKEQRVDAILQHEGAGRHGLIAILSSVDLCRSYEIHRNRALRQIELQAATRKCLHYYVYWNDPMFGRVQVRLQSWFPFQVHVVLNGREWLARQMDAVGLGYLRRDNCFVALEDFAQAQRLLDRQVRIAWPKHLTRLLDQSCPVLRPLFPQFPLVPYWSVDQSEWATDVVFRSREALAAVYPNLLQHAIRAFDSRDVLRFLGQKVPCHAGHFPTFAAPVSSNLRQRPEGMRVKHRLGSNSLKLYDKFGEVLRVETTLNQIRDLKAYRAKEGDPAGPKQWRRLRKGVADIRRQVQLAQAANQRYLQALAAAEHPQPLKQFSDRLGQRVAYRGRPVRALNLLAPEDARLLEVIARGEFALTGFRNADLREALYGATPTDPQLRRRQSARVTRLLRLLRAHRLIRKLPHTHRYVLAAPGATIAVAITAARNTSVEKLTQAA
jgi:hypothetical protein